MWPCSVGLLWSDMPCTINASVTNSHNSLHCMTTDCEHMVVKSSLRSPPSSSKHRWQDIRKIYLNTPHPLFARLGRYGLQVWKTEQSVRWIRTASCTGSQHCYQYHHHHHRHRRHYDDHHHRHHNHHKHITITHKIVKRTTISDTLAGRGRLPLEPMHRWAPCTCKLSNENQFQCNSFQIQTN